MIETSSQATEHVRKEMVSAVKIRLLIAEDHPIMRDTLHSVLKQYPEIDIVGEATNGEEAVLRAEEFQPAIILMDINMPRLDGIAATQRIKAKASPIAVIGLSVSGEGHLIDAMLKAGAVAVVQKENATEHLYDAIQSAIAHRLNIHPRQS
jgi:DNA-binding NarL/FixJ family response regulator